MYLCERIPEGTQVSSVIYVLLAKTPKIDNISYMIDRVALSAFVDDFLKDSDLFLVDVSVSKDNNVVVEIAGPEGVDIDTCVALTRAIEGEFDRDKEDYELEVGSAGLTSPFKVSRQYSLNKGNKVEVLTRGGEKLHGVLGDSDNEGFDLITVEKVKEPGAKRPIEKSVTRHFAYPEVKYTKCEIDF